MQTISCGTLTLASAILLEETRENVLLRRAAKALNKWHEECEKLGMTGLAGEPKESGQYTEKETQRIRWRTAGNGERDSIADMLRISLSRPFRKLTTLPAVHQGIERCPRFFIYRTCCLLVLFVDCLCLGCPLFVLRWYSSRVCRCVPF